MTAARAFSSNPPQNVIDDDLGLVCASLSDRLTERDGDRVSISTTEVHRVKQEYDGKTIRCFLQLDGEPSNVYRESGIIAVSAGNFITINIATITLACILTSLFFS